MYLFGRFALVISVCLALSGARVAAESLPDLYLRVNQAVVDIQAVSLEEVSVSNEKTTTVASESDGSGILIDEEGTILTASHVVQTAEKVVVRLSDGRHIPAKIVASANWGDIALLKIDMSTGQLPAPVQLADSDKVRIGDEVFVVGAPFGYSHSLSVGHVSSRFKKTAMIGTGSIEVFQTDAAMNPGNSGGPLFNMKGEVIGVASQIATVSGGFNGLAFAVTSNQILKLLEKVSSWSGIEGRLLSGELARLLNLPQPSGLLIQRVATNSWAGKIGLQSGSVAAVIGNEKLQIGGDILLQVGTLVVDSSPNFFQKMTDYLFAEAQAGHLMDLKILRGGKLLTIENVPVSNVQ